LQFLALQATKHAFFIGKSLKTEVFRDYHYLKNNDFNEFINKIENSKKYFLEYSENKLDEYFENRIKKNEKSNKLKENNINNKIIEKVIK
jgi:hypothetical protein